MYYAFWVCGQELLGSLEEEDSVPPLLLKQFNFSGTLTAWHCSSFVILSSCLFCFKFYYHSYMYQRVSALLARPPVSSPPLPQLPFIQTATTVIWFSKPLIWWRTGKMQGLVIDCLRPFIIERAVWKRVASEWSCLWTKHLTGDGSTLLPSHPHSLYPDKGKPLSKSDGAKHFWGSPFLFSFHPSLSVFLMLLSLSVWRGLLKSWIAYWKGDPGWNLFFLFRPLFRQSVQERQWKKGHDLKIQWK